jgi:hypothetical protein
MLGTAPLGDTLALGETEAETDRDVEALAEPLGLVDGLADVLGLAEPLGDWLPLGETERETDALIEGLTEPDVDGETLALTLALVLDELDGDRLAEGEGDRLPDGDWLPEGDLDAEPENRVQGKARPAPPLYRYCRSL